MPQSKDLIFVDIRFYYFRDDKRRPRVTLCRVITDDHRIGYGWAICGDGDNPNRDFGRWLAKGRAGAALRRGRQAQDAERTWVYPRPILRREAVDVLGDCQADFEIIHLSVGIVGDLPDYMRVPGLNDTEATLPMIMAPTDDDDAEASDDLPF